MDRRAAQLKRLEKESFEVLIIGSGINGAVAASALSTRGIKTALIDRGDFGGFTSQSSSNLIWGGIKYLESFEFGLVRQLCRSRNQLIRAYPSSIREIRFFTNLEKGARFPSFIIYLGTLLYWLIGSCFTRAPRKLSKLIISAEEPVINMERSNGGVEYSDAYLVEHDSRFVFQFVRRAMNEACAVANYVESWGSKRLQNGTWLTRAKDLRSGSKWTIRSRVVINACGPFVDRQNALSSQISRHRHVYSKGIHLVVPRLSVYERVLTFFADDGRLFFAIPMGNRTVVGTTDTRVSEPETKVTDEDRSFVLDNINKRLNLEKPLGMNDILAERLGVRPLVLETEQEDLDSDWTHLSRKHVIDADLENFYLSIFGGKLTDCLNIGEEICDLVQQMEIPIPDVGKRWFGEPGPELRRNFLDGARALGLDSPFYPGGLDSQALCLWRRYGEDAFELLDKIRDDPSQGEPVFPDAELLRAEVSLIAREEMPVTLEDFLRRRTRLALLFSKKYLNDSEPLREIVELLFPEDWSTRWDEYFG